MPNPIHVPRNPLLEKIKSKKVALGLVCHDPHMVELLSRLGFDFFFIDQMFTDCDWQKTQQLLWNGEAAGITPVVRVQSNPWMGYDPHISVDVQRLAGIGTQFILISNSGKKEIEDALVVSKDWHRRCTTVHQFEDLNWASQIDAMADQCFIVPQPETKAAFDELEETMALPGLKMIHIAMTDASRCLASGSDRSPQHNPDFESPQLWAYVKRTVELAGKLGITVGANTSYAYTLKGMRARVKRLVDAGITFVHIQTAPFLFQVAMTEWLEGVRSDIP